MARNRKRRSDRRPRRPADGASRPGVATARSSREREQTPEPLEQAPEPLEQTRDEPVEQTPEEPLEQAPEPLEHATPDVELAEAQLAVGRPELPDEAPQGAQDGDGDPGSDFGDEDDLGPGSSPVPTPGAAPSRRPGLRLVHFLQGSWRELQRVQWPDRRQVVQATGVVIGFVIVAGAFLGLADFVAGKIVHFILQ